MNMPHSGTGRRHADLWGKAGPYAYDHDEVLAQMGAFIEACRSDAEGEA